MSYTVLTSVVLSNNILDLIVLGYENKVLSKSVLYKGDIFGTSVVSTIVVATVLYVPISVRDSVVVVAFDVVEIFSVVDEEDIVKTTVVGLTYVQSSVPFSTIRHSQKTPVRLGGHEHVKLSTPSMQVPPFMHLPIYTCNISLANYQ